MYAEHTDPELFKKPPDENAPVWRYMDFAKFASLLTQRKLYFPTPNQLDDPFELSFPEATRQTRKDAIRPSLLGRMNEADAEREAQRVSGILGEAIRVMRPLIAISCWHLSGIESAAMWKIYATEHQGIAIRSTFKHLAESFHVHTEHNIYIGLVNYIDFEKDDIPEPKIISGSMYKRKSFEYEHEVRAVIEKLSMMKSLGFTSKGQTVFNRRLGAIDLGDYPLLDVQPSELSKIPPDVVLDYLVRLPISKSGIILPDKTSLLLTDDLVSRLGPAFVGGVNVAVDLDTLVDEIRVSPTATSWFEEAVRDVAMRFGFDPGKIRRSDLGRDPIF